MVCIQCGAETRVINSRHQKRSNQVWRRRQCQQCQAIFSTEEAARYEASWGVLRPSGAVTAFSRDKLFLSLYRSCQHRQTAADDAAALTDTIINKLAQTVTDGSLERATIISVSQVALNRFDKAASTHYAAFHREK